MRIDIFDQAVDLAANRTIVLHDALQAEVVCTRGSVWITEDPLRNDIVIEAGESHVVRAAGLTFVTGVTASTVWLREPLQAPAVRRKPQPSVVTSFSSVVERILGRLRRRPVPGGATA